jgi:hypothetical protein
MSRAESWHRCRPRFNAAALLTAVCAFMVVASSVTQRPRESDVEAAYLFNFAKFMHASAHSPDSFTIAVVGKSAIGPMLGTITANEQIDGRPLKVVQPATVDAARNCDIVFLADTETPHLDKDLATLAGSNALTVSNAPEFLQHGGMIQFLVVNDRVRFKVNLDASNKEKIAFSSELLRVAMSVSGSPGGEAQP